MTVIKGIYFNSELGRDEDRCIRCDSNGYIVGLPKLNFTAQIGALNPNTQIQTPQIDLGENYEHYTLAIAKKIGVASAGEFIYLVESKDGVNWESIVGLNQNTNTWSKSDNGSSALPVHGRPAFRFVKAVYKNGSVAQTNLKINFVFMAGV